MACEPVIPVVIVTATACVLLIGLCWQLYIQGYRDGKSEAMRKRGE